MAERFVFQIDIRGDKSLGHFTSYRTEIVRKVEFQVTSPAKLDEAAAILVKAAISEIIDELIERDEQAEKEPEE